MSKGNNNNQQNTNQSKKPLGWVQVKVEGILLTMTQEEWSNYLASRQ